MDNLPEKSNMTDIELKLSERGYVTLPFGKEDFRAFVVGLLGKPQVIEGEVKEPFEIDINSIRNIFELVNQRITQQNDGMLIQFTARIMLSDNSSVLLNSIDELITYNVIKPVITEALHLTFQYLIKFQDKQVPEKQEINISFVAANKSVRRNLRRYSVYTDLIHNSLSTTFLVELNQGYIQYNIKHTARTWAADIESILVNHFKTLIKLESPGRRFLRSYQSVLNTILFLTVLASGIVLSYNIRQDYVTERQSRMEDVFGRTQDVSLGQISNQLKFLADEGFFDTSLIYALGGLIGFLVAAICTAISSSMISEPKHSYVLLSSESVKNKEAKEKSYKKQFSNYIWSLVVSIGIGLLTNFIFEYLNK